MRKDRYKIEVTKTHIKKGEPQNRTECPVSLALQNNKKIKKSLYSPSVIAVHEDCIEIWDPFINLSKYHKLSLSTIKKVYEYDKTGKMKPFTFYFDKNPFKIERKLYG